MDITAGFIYEYDILEFLLLPHMVDFCEYKFWWSNTIFLGISLTETQGQHHESWLAT